MYGFCSSRTRAQLCRGEVGGGRGGSPHPPEPVLPHVRAPARETHSSSLHMSQMKKEQLWRFARFAWELRHAHAQSHSSGRRCPPAARGAPTTGSTRRMGRPRHAPPRTDAQLELERLLVSSVPVLVRGKPHAVARGAELAEACRRPGGPSPRAGGAAVHHGDSPASLNASLPSAALFLCSVQPVLSPANGGRALRVRLGRDRRSNRGWMAAVKPLSWCAAARRVGHEARHFSLCCVLRLLRKQRLVKCPNLAAFSTQLPKALCCRATAPPEATRSRRSRLARLSAPPCASKYHYGSVFRREAKRARRNH